MLLGPEGSHWIRLGGSSCGEVAGQEADGEEEDPDATEDRRIGRTHPQEHASGKRAGTEGKRQTKEEAEAHQPEPFPKMIR